jgi:hypothetical protein
VLAQARPTEDHKCSDEGQITLHLRFGRSVKLGTLAGHNPNYYEFRLYSGKEGPRRYTIYRVPIGEFVASMRRLGVTSVRPPAPDR